MAISWSSAIFLFIRFYHAYALSDVYQEALLHPYQSYSDIALFHYYAPSQTIRAVWQFAAFSDNVDCPVRDVHMFLQHESYPIINPDNSSFPENMYVSQGQVYSLKTKTQYKAKDAVMFSVYNPLPGNWFCVAYIPHWDQKIKQQGLAHKCRYSLDSVASWISHNEITLLTPDVPFLELSSSGHSYFKFYVPNDIWSFDIKIFNCTTYNVNSSDVNLLKSIGVSAKSLPFPVDLNYSKPTESYTYVNQQVLTDVYYYILVISKHPFVSYNVVIRLQECVHFQTNDQKDYIVTDVFEPMPVEVSYSHFHSNKTCMKEEWKSNFQRNVTVSSSVSFKNDMSSIEAAQSLKSENRHTLCYPIFNLARIKHAQDFLDTFVLQDRNWYSTWLSLTDKYPVLTRLRLLPFVDIGGTLKFKFKLDKSFILGNISDVIVNVCINHPSIQKFDDSGTAICKPGLNMTLNFSSPEATKYIPYPHPGLYYVSFLPQCFDQTNSTVLCPEDQINIELHIRLQPCIFEKKHSCGPHGYCIENNRGQFFFTACRCIGGWKGFGCTDGSSATPDYLLLLETLLVTLSNLFFLPAIILALKRHFFCEALLYTFTMIMSAFYHACDEEVYSYCLMTYEVLQFCDFFSAVLSFWVTIVAMSNLPSNLSPIAHMAGALGIALGVEYQRTGVLVFVIPISVGACLLIFRLFYKCCRATDRIGMIRWRTILKTVFGLMLVIGGVILFSLLETEQNYKYVHSAWHTLVAISILFLLPEKSSSASKEASAEERRSLSESSPSNDSELLDVTNYNITSDIDLLIEDAAS